MLRLTLCVGLALGTGLSMSQIPNVSIDNCVKTDKAAYMVMPPDQAVPHNVTWIKTFPGSTNVLFEAVGPAIHDVKRLLAQTVAPEEVLPGYFVWNADKNKVVPVTGIPRFSSIDRYSVEQLGNKGHCVIQGSSPGDASDNPNPYQFTAVLDLSTGKSVLLGGPSYIDEQIEQAATSPLKPVVAVLRMPFDKPSANPVLQLTVDWYGIGGEKLTSGRIDAAGRSAYIMGWTEDGTHAVITVYAGRGQERSTIVARPDGTLVKTSESLKYYMAPSEEAGLGLVIGENLSQLGKDSAPAKSLWLTADGATDPAVALIATSCDGEAFFLGGTEKIVYVNRSRMYVCTVATVDPVLFQSVIDAAERTEALSIAKQINTAVQIYLSDSSDLFPDQRSFKNSISPYVRNDEMLSRFVYTMNGGSASAIKDPAKTEMGYVPVKGGRCVAYVDGHAAFVPDPPKG